MTTLVLQELPLTILLLQEFSLTTVLLQEFPLPTLVLQDRAPEGLIPSPSPVQALGTGIFIPAAPGALWEPWQPRAVQGAALPADPWGTGSLGTLQPGPS